MDFTKQNLSYLLKQNYDAEFISAVYSLPTITVDSFMRNYVLGKDSIQARTAFRVEYDTMLQYTEIARKLHIMTDTKVLINFAFYYKMSVEISKILSFQSWKIKIKCGAKFGIKLVCLHNVCTVILFLYVTLRNRIPIHILPPS